VTYRWIDHTAEVELRIDAETDEAVFADALRAYAELVDRGASGDPARHDVSVSATDPAALLAAWVEELVFLAETEEFVPERVTAFSLREGELQAVVEGRRGTPAPLVKAVTYHNLEYERGPRGIRARLVLDV
jgi:SHS2 domain-containing protein